MRIQLSFEMQLYTALAGIAILAALSEMAWSAPRIISSVERYSIGSFVDTMNENVLEGNATFVAYVPVALCNATFNGDALHTAYGPFPTVAEIGAVVGTFCPGGGMSRLHLTYYGNGRVMVSA